MKKPYIPAQTTVFEVNVNNIICASPGGLLQGTGLNDDTVDTSSSDVTVLSRRGSIWDDEE